jgi:hypothetical protein
MLNPIHEAHKAGLKMRTDQKRECGPMPISLYKLREYQRNLQDTKESLEEIGDCTRIGLTPYALRHCMGYEKSKWSKSRPEALAQRLGQNLVGALHGLVGDGVPERSIKHIEQQVLLKIPDLLRLGEKAHIELNGNWPIAGRRLGTGKGTMDQFVQDCLDLIQWVATTAEAAIESENVKN